MHFTDASLVITKPCTADLRDVLVFREDWRVDTGYLIAKHIHINRFPGFDTATSPVARDQ